MLLVAACVTVVLYVFAIDISSRDAQVAPVMRSWVNRELLLFAGSSGSLRSSLLDRQWEHNLCRVGVVWTASGLDFILATLNSELAGAHRRCPPGPALAFDEDDATDMESRIGGDLPPTLVREAFEKMQGVPIFSLEEELARRPNLVVDVLDHKKEEGSIWACLDEWLKVLKPDVHERKSDADQPARTTPTSSELLGTFTEGPPNLSKTGGS
ncbi:hypothetical protein Q7P37_009757 [Cladosporium fusiforme]